MICIASDPTPVKVLVKLSEVAAAADVIKTISPAVAGERVVTDLVQGPTDPPDEEISPSQVSAPVA